MSDARDTVFSTTASGTGGAAGDYLVDNFQDTSNAATSNQGFSDTILTNPLGGSFQNDDMPKYAAKMLTIKSCSLIDDKTKWINNKPTYQITFNETFPGVIAYAFGDIRLRNTSNGIALDILQVDDGFGVTGVIRKLMYHVNAVNDATANADLILDSVDTTTDITFGAAALQSVNQGYNKYVSVLHSTSNQTKNIHDYRITANQTALLSVWGVTVYFENATTDIDLFAGSTYVNKVKLSTTGITNMPVPAYGASFHLGANTLVFKNSAGYSSIVSTIPTVNSLATGTSGGNLITVTTGHGASFPAGSGVVAQTAGGSFYVGSVASVSTDTLTVGPTLTFALSSEAIYKAWYGGPTLAISATLYAKSYSFDAGYGTVQAQSGNGLAAPQTGTLFYSDQNKRYRFWGASLSTHQTDGYYGVGFVGASGFMQFDFYGAALDLKVASVGGIVHGTFLINGAPSWGINEGVTGVLKKTVFTDAGQNYHSVVFKPGSSMGTGVAFSDFQVYEVATSTGMTLGNLASYETLTDRANRSAINATLMQLGTFRRYYADDLYLTGGWLRGTTATVAGGVFYVGSSTNSAFEVQYFGQQFALIGTAASANITFDGASIITQMNVGYSIGTLGFHKVNFTVAAAGQTAIIQAVDVLRPTGGIRSRQKFLPRSELDKAITIYQQSDSPRGPKPGDIWAENTASGNIWIYLFSRWNRLNVSYSVDDPNSPVVMIKSHGSTTVADAQVTNDAEIFNFVAWSTVASDTTSGWNQGAGQLAAFGFHHASDLTNSSAVAAAVGRRFNKVAWGSFTTRTTRTRCGWAVLNGVMYAGGGQNSAGSPVATMDAWNNASWSAALATLSTTRVERGGFFQGNLAHFVGGDNAGRVTTHDTFDGTSASTSTANPATSTWSGVQTRNGDGGLVTAGWDSAGTTASYEWTGSWSASITVPATLNSDNGGLATGHFPSQSASIITNGTIGSAVSNATYTFINSSYALSVASGLSRPRAVGSAF